MRDWREFFDNLGEHVDLTNNTVTQSPGEVMICFVNRFLEGLDGIKYRIVYDGRVFESVTTAEKYCVKISPETFNPIVTYVWSRMNNRYKKLDEVVPNVGSKKLVRKVLKTYKVAGQTSQHPVAMPIATAPVRPASAAAPGPSPISAQGVTPVLRRDESGLPQTNVERPVPYKITAEQLKKIFPAAAVSYLQQIADELNRDLVKFKLDTAVRRAHFFGQTRQETGTAAKGDAESLKYPPARLKATFSYYKDNPEEADEDGRIVSIVIKNGKTVRKVIREAKEEVIANKAYGRDGVGKTLGNEQAGDGWKFRGRGLKQTTGRDNYGKFMNEHEKIWGLKIDFIGSPDLVAQFPYTVRSAVVFWLTKKCWQVADNGVNNAAIDAVTKIVNAGEIRNHLAGKYATNNNPVLNRRAYVNLAYLAFV